MTNIIKQMENQMNMDLRAKNEVFISCTILKETDKAINVMFVACCKQSYGKYDEYTKRVYAWFPKSRTQVIDEHTIKAEGWLLVSKMIEAGVDADEYKASGWLEEDTKVIKDCKTILGEEYY